MSLVRFSKMVSPQRAGKRTSNDVEIPKCLDLIEYVKLSFPTRVVVSSVPNIHFQNTEADDLEPKAAPGTPHGPTGALKTHKGKQRDTKYNPRCI